MMEEEGSGREKQEKWEEGKGKRGGEEEVGWVILVPKAGQGMSR